MSLGTMRASELKVLATQGQFIYVISPHGTTGYDWPTTFDWRGARFKYVCSETITHDIEAGGHAKYEMIQRTCGQCSGKGYIDTPAMRCGCCGGTGVIEVAPSASAPTPSPARNQCDWTNEARGEPQ